ncbi:MAG: hypothetical protein ACMUIA_10505, partial [bacterium]
YMNKHENLPALRFISPGVVLEGYRKMDLFSIEGSTTIADTIELHGGATYRHPDHKRLYGRFFQYLIGFNYTVDQKLFFDKQINISCEYLGKGDVDQPDSRFTGLDFIRLFEDSLFIQAGIALTGFSDFTLSNLSSIDQILNDILRLEYVYTPNYKLELGFGADFIWGDGNVIFEQFEKNDRTWVKIQYIF